MEKFDFRKPEDQEIFNNSPEKVTNVIKNFHEEEANSINEETYRVDQIKPEAGENIRDLSARMWERASEKTKKTIVECDFNGVKLEIASDSVNRLNADDIVGYYHYKTEEELLRRLQKEAIDKAQSVE